METLQKGESGMEHITVEKEKKNPEKEVKILKQYFDLMTKENKEKE